MAKTTAHIKDDRLTIMTPNARTASVMSLEMNKVKEGSFVINDAKDGGFTLEFKHASRKTGDVIAIYNQSSDAAKALEAVFKAIGGQKKSVVGFILYILKILALTILALIIIAALLFFTLGKFMGDMTSDVTSASTSTNVVSTSETSDSTEPQSLPIGEPFLVDTYVETLDR